MTNWQMLNTPQWLHVSWDQVERYYYKIWFYPRNIWIVRQYDDAINHMVGSAMISGLSVVNICVARPDVD